MKNRLYRRWSGMPLWIFGVFAVTIWTADWVMPDWLWYPLMILLGFTWGHIQHKIDQWWKAELQRKEDAKKAPRMDDLDA